MKWSRRPWYGRLDRLSPNPCEEGRPVKHNTAVEFAYNLLRAGVHLDEIKRFVDANVTVDPAADTIPAPASVDPTTVSTVPSPPMPASMPPVPLTLPKRTAVIDLSGVEEEFWSRAVAAE